MLCDVGSAVLIVQCSPCMFGCMYIYIYIHIYLYTYIYIPIHTLLTQEVEQKEDWLCAKCQKNLSPARRQEAEAAVELRLKGERLHRQKTVA